MNPPQAVLTSAQVRQAEQGWAKQNQRASYVLMQRAAKSFVAHFLNSFKNKTVTVFAGSGNNGGDGFLIACYLKQASIAVEVVVPLGLPEPALDAHLAYLEFKQAGGVERSDLPQAAADVAIDALFGSGLNRALSAEIISLIQQINQRYLRIISVDVPSGLNADTGYAMPSAITAESTHSFIAFKPGLLTAQGPHFCGTLTLDTLGVEPLESKDLPLWQFDDSLSALPNRCANTHKSEHGQVWVVGGKPTMLGAAIITARAALNAGAGKVRVQGDISQLAAFLAATPELMIADGAIDVNQVVVIGPGLGRDEQSKLALQQALASQPQAGVIDADALHLLKHFPETDLSQWLLTPHEGEAAALLNCTSKEVQQNRTGTALKLAKQFKTTVVLKGAGSIVAQANQLHFCHPGSAAMATPGMGDCLAGIIGSLLAQGLAGQAAAITGVNLHAQIGAQLAQQQRIVLASDIIDALKFKA